MRHRKPMRALFPAAALAMGLSLPVRGAESVAESLALDAPQWEVAGVDVRLGGHAGAALFTATQLRGPIYPDGYDNTRASAEARANVRAQRILDNGMILGIRSDFLLYHDDQSGDRYDSDTVELLYGFVQTGFGRIEIGQTDGAAFTLGLSGPLVNEVVTLEDPKISLFRNPAMGRNFADFFRPITAVQSSSNFAKINYVSPRLLGVQIGGSFTPRSVRAPLPWTGNPSDDPDQQQNIWEVAGNYTSVFSGVALGFSAGYARGALRHATASGADLYDLALGTQLAYTLSEVRLSLGGGYRDTNAYLLSVQSVLDGSKTHAGHVAATAEWNDFRFGLEYSKADVRGPVAYKIIGYETALAYKINDNLELAAGWQWYDYARNTGTFYNGLPNIDMNAGFLTFAYGL